MSFLKTLALLFLSMVLIISATFAVFGSGLNSLLYPEIYQDMMEKNGVYELALRSMNVPEGVVTVDDIKPIINDVMNRVFAYIRSETNQLNLTLSLQSDIVRNAALSKLRAMPQCEIGQTPLNGTSLVCIPAGTTPEMLVSLLPESAVPSVDLSTVVNVSEIQRAREAISTFRTVLVITIIIAIACAAVIILLTRSLKSTSRWIGANLVIIGIIGISFLLVKDLLPSTIGGQEVIATLLKEILVTVADSIVFYGSVLLIAGIALIVFSFFADKIKKQ